MKQKVTLAVKNALNFITDLLFPPSEEALLLRKLSPENIFAKLPPAPTPPYPFIISVFAYKNPVVSELIWHIKYRKDKHAFRCGGRALYKKLCIEKIYKNEPGGKSGSIVLIPIPLSKERRKERGYNQCEMLIENILKCAEEDGVGEMFKRRYDILFRTKHLERQTDKKRNDRIKDTENIFKAHKVELAHPIILIDDVATTGSTLKEAREALLKVGYADISALTIAH